MGHITQAFSWSKDVVAYGVGGSGKRYVVLLAAFCARSAGELSVTTLGGHSWPLMIMGSAAQGTASSRTAASVSDLAMDICCLK